nr:hypothetical protein [Mycoplasmopsis bovis]
MIKDEKLKKCLTLQKYFGTIKNKSSFRNESLHNRVYKLLALIIATKVKNNLIRLNLHQNYSFRQIIEYLRSYKVEVINDTEWKKRKGWNMFKTLRNC